MSELPRGWSYCSLAELVGSDGLLSDGDWVESKDQDPGGNIRLLQLADVGDGKFLNKSARFINEDAFTRLRCTEVVEGDVLIARMPDPLGRACLVPKLVRRAVTVVDVAIARPASSEAHKPWLMRFLNAPQVREVFEREASGTTRKRIARSKLASLQLPVPPSAEQKRIADKLDRLLAAIDTCKARLDAIPAILKRFRQSVLAAATSGKLTEDWRVDHRIETETQFIDLHDGGISVPSSWARSTINDVIDAARPLCYGVVQPGEAKRSGVPLIRVQDLDLGSIRVADLRTVSPDVDAEYRRSRVKAGDLLISVVGTIGRTAVVPYGLEANIARAIARIACRDGVETKWIDIWLKCDFVQWMLLRSSREVARKTLNLSELAGIAVALPSIEEQREIIRRVDVLFDRATSVLAKYAVAHSRVDRLAPTLLARAFRGDIVPQDPSDEPAEKFLERLKAERNQPKGHSIKAKLPRIRVTPEAAMQFKSATDQRSEEAVVIKRSQVSDTYLSDLLAKSGKRTPETLWKESQLEIDEFFELLRDEETAGRLREIRPDKIDGDIFLEKV